MRNIGILGSAGSGKGTAAKFFSKKYKYKSITMSDVLRDIARKKKISPTRENLEKIQNIYRKKYGNDFVAKEAVKKIKNYKGPIVFDGLRTISDVKLIKRKTKAKIILITAPPEVRFKRLKKRKRIGFSKTLKEFKKMEIKENKIFKFNKVFKYADYKANNAKNRPELNNQLLKLIKKLK